MLHPLQLQEASQRYAAEIAELRTYLQKAGVPVETPAAIATVASSLRNDPAFHRDLTLHTLVLFHAPGHQVTYADAMAIFALAAAGPAYAAQAAESDTRDLLRFVMEARNSFATPAAAPVSAAPVIAAAPAISSASVAAPAPLASEPYSAQPVLPLRGSAPTYFEPAADSDEDDVPTFTAATNEDSNPRRLAWIGLACALLILCLGFWLHHQFGSGNTPVASAPATAPLPQAVAANREASAPSVTSNEALPNWAGASNSAPAAPAPRETSHTRKPLPPPASRSAALPAPRHAAPPYSPPAQSYAAAAAQPAPAPAIVASKPTAAPAPAIASPAPRPESRPQPIVSSNRNPAPLYRGPETTPLVVLHTPVVRPTTLGNMASHLTYGPAPQYPSAAVDQNIQGQVRLEAEVDRAGNVISTRVVSGPPLLQEAAVNALQTWQYRPWTYEGKPIAVNATVVMDFQLQ